MQTESDKPPSPSAKSIPLVLMKVRRRGFNRALLESFAQEVRGRVTGGAEFCCLVSNDVELRRLNREFLGKDCTTDVLSFPSAHPRGHLGDIAISVDRAGEQAAALGHDLMTELRILLLHGVLHLKGHDHETDRGSMRRIETRWRKVFGLPAGLIERAKG